MYARYGFGLRWRVKDSVFSVKCTLLYLSIICYNMTEVLFTKNIIIDDLIVPTYF